MGALAAREGRGPGAARGRGRVDARRGGRGGNTVETEAWSWPGGRRGCARLIAVVCCTASPAHAYRTAADLDQFSGSERVAWASETIPYEIFVNLPPGVDTATFEGEVEAAFGSWQHLFCGGPSFEYRGTTGAAAAPGDGVNTVEWVAEGWTERGFPAQAGGFTDIGYVRDPGGAWRIAEADLYINGQDHDWLVGLDLGLGIGLGPLPLWSLLVHEGGHMLGLMHPCEVGGVDDAPDCADHPEMAELAMHPLYDASRLRLREDDIGGACYLYPGTNVVPSEAVSIRDCRHDPGACLQGTECRNGWCERGTLLAGDPCATHFDCASRICTAEGFCGTPCYNEDGCTPEQTCEPFDGWGSVCTGPGPGALGADCEDASDCTGGQCVDQQPGPRFCSRLCDAVECPEGWECKTVEEREVCVPFRPDITGGCHVARLQRGGPGGAPVPWAPGVLLFALASAGGSRLARHWGSHGRRRSPRRSE
jgi:hypothetical protein